MFKNYIKIAIRSFQKDRVNTLISLSGLVIGLTCVMLIAGYIRYETSFDKSYRNSSRIYRLISTYQKNNSGPTENVPVAFAPTLIREVPGFAGQTRISTYTTQVLIKNQYTDLELTNVDSSFFSIFNFAFIHGNAATAIKSADNIVLTASAAKKLYGTTDIVGKTLENRDKVFMISAVLQDLPQNSFLQTDAFCFNPLSKKSSVLDVSGGYNGGNAFILLDENTSVADAESKIQQFCNRYKMNDYKITLQPVSQIHLHSSEIKDELARHNIGDIRYVYIYAGIALLILIIGSINFINLAIARSMERTKEVGVRKVLGAQRKQLILQFLGESVVYFAAAFLVAIILAVIAWKGFTDLSNIVADTSFLLNTDTLLIITCICIFSCVISGIYPALFLSGLQPVHTLKSGYQQMKLNFGLRKVLIVIQFSISIMLVVATFTVYSQLHYLNNRPLGFNKDNLIRFQLPYLDEPPQAFKNEVLHHPAISALSFAGLDMGKTYSMYSSMSDPVAGHDSTNLIKVAIIDVDIDFMNTMQIPIMEGRDFSRDFPSDMTNYDSIAGWTGADPGRPLIVSESLVKRLDIKGPIGAVTDKDFFLKGTIVGVFKNFSAMSLKEEAPVLAIRCKPDGKNLRYVYARINATNTAASIAYLAKTYKQFFPREKFDFSFIDDRVAHLYDTEIRLTKLSNIFSFLAIALSCMGLFSLVSLMVRKRTKEIGIRKVLGASVSGIILLIGKDFLWLIIISFIIATPLAYMAMTKWLEGYANRTTLYWWIFLIAGAVAFLIAFISISFKSISAAKANPVNSLRTE